MTSILPLLLSCGGPTPPAVPGVFVLGIDGMDPEILQRMMDEGRMPNFKKLASDGDFVSLGTSNPPQSPVAWSNFVTGEDPGGHGIFDFVHRDPAHYHPISSATPVVDPGSAIELGGYFFPIGAEDVGNNRGGVPWWDTLHDAGVDVEVYRIPGNYPVPESEAKVLSGMGTVDMRGGYGTYTLFTDKVIEKDNPKGDIQRVSLQDFDLDGVPDTATGLLKGPPDIFHLPPGQEPHDSDYLATRVTIELDKDSDTAVIKVGDEVVLLQEGEWSDWVGVSFDALPHGLMTLHGAVRFYAMELRPNLVVYTSPVNMSAEEAPQVVTSPDDWIEELYEALGQFYTQGMPEETDALKDGVFTDDDYIKQVALVQQDTRSMLDFALRRFGPGDVTFVYMSDIDLQCHMLWRHWDPKYPGRGHPARDEDVEVTHRHHDDIENFYLDVDAALGTVSSQLPADTLLLVMSDHGFQPYTRKLHLNAWLRDNGYLYLKDGATTGHIATEGSVDWSRTKAYGIGFNGLYINEAGREGQGIVAPGDRDALMTEISEKLTAYRDPEDGGQVVLEVFRARDIYHGDRLAEAPDLVVGFNEGYGNSDPSTLGEITEEVIGDNTSRWSGNHLMDPKVVPGVLLSNRDIPEGDWELIDLTTTLLAHYGVDKGELRGRSVFGE